MPTVDQPVDALSSARGFSDLLYPHLATVALVARRFAPAAEADDVAQEALLAAWRYRDRFDPQRGTFRAWLLAIVMTEIRREYGRRLRRGRLVAHLAMQTRTGPIADGEPRAEREVLERAIAGLSRRQREVIGLYYFVDLPIDEVATVLGLSPGTVKSTLATARDRMRRTLGGEQS